MNNTKIKNNSDIKDAYKIFAVIGVLAFSALFVNILIIFKSIQTSDGLVEENYYNHGLNYQQVMDQQSSQEKLGWKINLSSTTPLSMNPIESKEKVKADSYLSDNYKSQHKISLVAKQKDLYSLAFFDKSGKPVKNADVKISFFRPTQSGFDQDITLQEKQDGLYQSQVILARDGIWDLYINVKKDGQKWKKKERIRIIN